MIYIDSKNTVTFYDAPEIIETAIHNLLMHIDEVDVGMGYDGALTRPAYEQGLNDGWELAKKIYAAPSDGGYTLEQLTQIFRESSMSAIARTYTASDAIAKIKAYEEKKKADAELRVGDEIEISGASADVPRMVVTQIDNQYVSTVDAKGDTRCICKNTNTFVKTGRHFPQVEEMLKQMKGE